MQPEPTRKSRSTACGRGAQGGVLIKNAEALQHQTTLLRCAHNRTRERMFAGSLDTCRKTQEIVVLKAVTGNDRHNLALKVVDNRQRGQNDLQRFRNTRPEQYSTPSARAMSVAVVAPGREPAVEDLTFDLQPGPAGRKSAVNASPKQVRGEGAPTPEGFA